MKLIAAFLRLIRVLNLVFIALTQVLFQYCIIVPGLEKAQTSLLLTPFQFILLSLASVLIAAGGYIINDYFDLNIDRLNRPDKLVVEKMIKRRYAILWHLALSLAGILLSFYVGWKINNLLLGFANLACALLLWFYSTSFKKKLLVGNVIISLLTAWVVLVLYVALIRFYGAVNVRGEEIRGVSGIFKLSILYAGFAFIISLVREVVKDMEDMPGDERHGCRTMPIVWGLQASRVFVATWLIVLIGSITVIQVYVLPFHWWWPALYSLFFILGPLMMILRKLFQATRPEDFHALSQWIKFVMLMGIVSMIFFKIYA